MPWFDPPIPAAVPQSPIIINDSKTPSGRVHVGALRGVLIHDAVYRTLKQRGMPVRYLFGVDDYDPLDEIPANRDDHFRQYLGRPLCNVPPPPGSTAPDMAEHYISEFFEVFAQLGVETEKYRMRDVYRSGRFNEPIDGILRKAEVVRRVYKEVSNSDRPADWLPFQVICENCGRIGTTVVSDYSGGEVSYVCRKDLVTWAEGCGHRGRMSPFDGGGKLPWKLEWAAKWRTFPVTIEGAGKDHGTRGGSRDVAARCLREIFGQEPPVNIPYEFFLVEGAKMSSSRGIGAAVKDVANFLPPEELRFLILRTFPSRPVDFSLDQDFMVKLFNEFDRLQSKAFSDANAKAADKQLYHLCEVAPEGPYFAVNFQLLLTLLQMPHIDMEREIVIRRGGELTPVERRHFERRRHAAALWLDRYASEDEKLRLQDRLPARAASLTDTQRLFLHRLMQALATAAWEENELQAIIFDVARRTPLEATSAFQAIYRVLFDRESGPRAGSIIAFLDKRMVLERFSLLPFSLAEHWRETGVPLVEVCAWVQGLRAEVLSASVRPRAFTVEVDRGGTVLIAGIGAVDLSLTPVDGKTLVRRVSYEIPAEAIGDVTAVRETLAARADEAIAAISQALGAPPAREPLWHQHEAVGRTAS